MPFVRLARECIPSNPNADAKRALLDFLLDGHIGMNNAVRIGDIVAFLATRRYEFTYSRVQTELMNPLRNDNVFIGSYPGRGCFIIETRIEADAVSNSLRRRAETQMDTVDRLNTLIREVFDDENAEI